MPLHPDKTASRPGPSSAVIRPRHRAQRPEGAAPRRLSRTGDVVRSVKAVRRARCAGDRSMPACMSLLPTSDLRKPRHSVMMAATPRGRLVGFVISVLLLTTTPTFAQTYTWWFNDRAYFDPLLAEPRAARTQLIVPAVSEEFEYQEQPGDRLTWQITLGRELPIWGKESQLLAGDTRPLQGRWGFGVWLPVSFHMIEDFKDESAPIINTDMRFGVMTKTLIGLGGQNKNDYSLGIRFTPWAHESTHLGDEFSISAERRRPDFERINISYEYTEYGLSFESPTLTLRHGGIYPLGKDGYYSGYLLPAQGGRVVPTSRENFEPSLGFEYRRPSMRTRKVFMSLDARWRTIYDYSKPNDDVREERQWSYSLMIGLTTLRNTSGVPLKALYFHLYHGVNPHGQFRSQRDYTFFGIGFTFDR